MNLIVENTVVKIVKKCKCGSDLYVDTSLMNMSNPPCYTARCKSCYNVEYVRNYEVCSDTEKNHL